jgi:hypothetical protein
MRRRPVSRQLAAPVAVLLGGAALLPGAATAADATATRAPLFQGMTGAQAATPDAIIRGIINEPGVSARIAAWGPSVEDVQHGVDVMSSAERARLMFALTRPRPTSASYGQADYRARYLVMVSLMRDSQVFAGIPNTRLRIHRVAAESASPFGDPDRTQEGVPHWRPYCEGVHFGRLVRSISSNSLGCCPQSSAQSVSKPHPLATARQGGAHS